MKKKNDFLGEAVTAKKPRGAEKVGGGPPPATLPVPTLRPLTDIAAQESTGLSEEIEQVRKPVFYSGGGASSPSASAEDPAPSLGEEIAFVPPGEDAEARARYESALAAAEALEGQTPQYDSRYDEQIRALYEQITGRGPFRYDSATDPLYRQYVQDYTRRGKLAMQDTMGRAAALTGGYGSSYAQSVGQQQYDAYLRRLADILPQTYGMALDAYKAEGQELQQRLATTEALEKSDYARYLDALGQHNRTLDRAYTEADNERAEMIAAEERAYRRAADDYARRVDAEERSYGRRQDYYARLADLVAAGYSPSAAEYALSGMTSSQAKVLRERALASSARSSGGGSRRKKKTEEKDDESKETQRGQTSGKSDGALPGAINKTGPAYIRTPNRK